MVQSLKTVLMQRDGLTSDQAEAEISMARDMVYNEGYDPEEVLHDEFGLEPDYVFDLI